MRAILSLLTILLLTGMIAIGAGSFWVYQQYLVPGPLQEKALFTIEKGIGVSLIAKRLEENNVISNAEIFRIMARLHGADKKLKAGEYEFAAKMSMHDVLQQLESGEIYLRQFTIPEGYTSWQVVQVLKTTPELEGDIKEIPKEGSLLPDTYSYVLGETRQQKIDQMINAMSEAFDQIWDKKPDDAPLLSKAEALILASIIEKETAVASERRTIAGVFHNRLKKGMKLQTDPTVIYAITGGKIKNEGKGPLGRRLLTKDLQYNSPYNTYVSPGLPPGPIANPGKASIEAALNPEKHEFLFFVADGTGGHVFSKTLAEHNNNVAKWRKIRAGKKN